MLLKKTLRQPEEQELIYFIENFIKIKSKNGIL